MVRALDKRRDPNYVQVTGYVPKELGLQFKIACSARDIDRTEGIEEALRLWLEKQTETGIIVDLSSKESKSEVKK